MGQKIHPIGFRLGVTKEHKSCWYADAKHYPELLQEDRQVRDYITKNLSNAGISSIRIERKADQIDLAIHTARPGVVVGRGGSGIEQLRAGLQQELGGNRQIRINVIEVSRVDADAALIAEYITQRAQRAEVKGIKIQVGGRLNGAEIARTEWVREGRVPLHTLRADIDYSYRTAQTIYGILGVKVWIFKGEIIPGQEEQPVPMPTQAPRRQRRRQQFEDRSNEE
jgi:small subunit ribosomal protein S3